MDDLHIGSPENIIDSRLFKLENLYEFETKKCTFCENGRKKVFAAVSNESLYLFLLNAEGNKSSKEIPWDTNKYSIIDLCFDPSGTWLLVLSQTTLQIVPVLPFLEPDVKHDLKWPTNKITIIALNPSHVKAPSAIVWWQTKESQQIVIIGDKAGDLIFFSLENLEIIGKSCIVGGIHKLTIYIDDSLDVITLLITSSKSRQWKLTLEQRFCQYNWVTGKKEQRKGKELNKKIDGFIASIKELSSDKMSTLFQSKSQSVSDVPNKLSTPVSRCNPTPISFEYFQKDDPSKVQDRKEQTTSTPANIPQWVVSPQGADGRHFVSLFNSIHGTFILQFDIEDPKPVFTYRLGEKLEDLHTILWQDKIIYTFGKTSMKILSSHFASHEEDSNISIWEDELDEGEHIVAAFGVSESANFPPNTGKWNDSANIKSLDLPRFSLNSSLVVSNKKIYLLTTRCDPCEWLVGELVEGHRIAERTAAALKTCLQPLLVAAADVLLAQNKLQQAFPLYKLAKVGSDEPLMKCAALGLYSEMLSSDISPQSSLAANVCFISHALQAITNKDNSQLLNFIKTNTLYSVRECLILCTDFGLWRAVETVAFEKGMQWQSFKSLLRRFTSPCRGLWSVLLTEHFAPFIVSDTALPLLKYIEQYCETFDTILLMKLSIWMCPLQDCFHIIFRALSTSQPNTHLSGMRRLIRTFFGVVSTLHSRISSKLPKELSSYKNSLIVNETVNLKTITNSENDPYIKNNIVACGHAHWAISCQGKLILSNSNGAHGFMNIDLDLIGKVISVSCGRNHTLLLTENGVYSIGDNRYGQLGIGPKLGCSLDTPVFVSKIVINRSKGLKQEVIIQVIAGQYHSAYITNEGSLYTWGWGVHGQLAHGTITDEFTPKRVDTLYNETVKSVGCGACHTTILTHSGSVFVCGSGVFGQIGHAGRQKCDFPHRVDLGSSPITKIAVGYFHTLALTDDNELWIWGSSPQSLRVGARGARRQRAQPKETNENPTSEDTEPPPLPSPIHVEENTHLYPTKVNISNVKGKIIKMAAGWHHSCLLDNSGSLYVWGLNLDGQLGTGDQKEVTIPIMSFLNNSEDINAQKSSKDVTTPVIESTKQPSTLKFKINKSAEEPDKQLMTSNKHGIICDVNCGADFSIVLSTDGKTFIAGNSYQRFQDASAKGGLRVVKLKNTKRVIKLPNSRVPAQQHFRQLPLAIMNTEIQTSYDISLQRISNPISCLRNFKNPSWGNDILTRLHQFVDDDTPLVDIQLRAELASMRGDYAEALNLKLNALCVGNHDLAISPMYVEHSNIVNDSKIRNSLLRMIKRLSRIFLGDVEFSENDTGEDTCTCQCNEMEYLVGFDDYGKCELVIDVTSSAILTIKYMLTILPQNTDIWAECIHQATLFWIDHGLNMNDLENIFTQAVSDGRAVELASAIFCTKDNIDYQKHLSTAFNLDLCNSILQSW